MYVRSRTQIPAFVNPLAGNATLARAVLRDSGRFEIEDVPRMHSPTVFVRR